MREDPGHSDESLSRALGGFLDAAHQVPPFRLAELIASYAGDLGADATRVWLADHQQRTLVHLAASEPEKALSISSTAAGRAYITSEVVEPASDTDRRHLWVPLLDGVDRIGVLEIEVGTLDPARRDAFRHLASVATAEIITRGQYTDLFTQTRRVRPMSLAAEMQWQALPPGSFSTQDVTVAAMMEPAYDVGGDSFDYAHAEGRLSLAILDAVGHDVGSSLVSSLALGALRNSRRSGQDLRGCAACMDEAIREQLGSSRFATGQLAELDTASGELRWLNAGHPLPLLIRRGRVVGTLTCQARLPFGLGHLLADQRPEISVEQLEPGDGVFFYSDGVVEARRLGSEDFGVDRLEEFLSTAFAAAYPPAETLRRLSNAVLDFHHGTLQDDATTLLAVWQPER